MVKLQAVPHCATVLNGGAGDGIGQGCAAGMLCTAPPHAALISPRTIALNAGVEFTVLFGAAEIGQSTGVLAVVVGSLAISSLPPGRLVSRVLTMSCS